MKKTSFLILAAGDSKRIKSKIPKFAFKIKKKSLIIWQLEKISKFNFKTYIFIQSKHLKYLNSLKIENAKLFENTEIIFQSKKKGIFYAMDEAIRQIKTKYIISIWCDQILISNKTYKRVIGSYNKLILPLVKTNDLYIQVKVNQKLKILERNEGDKVEKIGMKDIGLFKFDNFFFQKLIKKNKDKIPDGNFSGEKNFLKLFQFILLKDINLLTIKNVIENIGINTRKDVIKVKHYLN